MNVETLQVEVKLGRELDESEVAAVEQLLKRHRSVEEIAQILSSPIPDPPEPEEHAYLPGRLQNQPPVRLQHKAIRPQS